MYWIICYLLESAKLCLAAFSVLRYSWVWEKRQKVLVMTYHVIVVTIAVLPVVNEQKISVITFLILLTVITLLRYKRYCIVVIGIYFVIGLLDAAFAGMICGVAGWSSQKVLENHMLGLGVDSFSLALIIALACIRNHKGSEKTSFESRKIEKYVYVLLGSLLMITIFLVPLQQKILEEKDRNAALGVSACLIVFLGLLCTYFFYIRKYKDKEYENNEYRMIVKKQKQYYDDLVIREADTRKFRHDIRHQLYYLKRLLENDHITNGIEYLQNVLTDCNSLGMQIETGNYILNIVVEDIIKESDNILLTWNGCFPEKTQISDTDLCILFSNILKNAREEILELAEKSITVTIKCRNDSVSVVCRNAVDPKRIHESRDDNKGWGLIKIKDIVRKYDGDIKIERNEEYIIQILFYGIF